MKLNKKLIGTLVLALLFSTLFFAACKKDAATSSTSGTQKLSVFLTDDPSIYDSVLIDIKYLEVKLDNSDAHKDDDRFGDADNDQDDDGKGEDRFGKWDTLSFTPGIYDISKLRNGLDTLLGTDNIKGTIRKIRITLGNNNSIFIGGVNNSLHLLPGINNYLYVKIKKEHHHEDISGQTALWIDFDLSRSIVYSNGQYFLKPVLHPFCDENFASLKGEVSPSAASALITVYNGSDTSNGIPREDGKFKLRGLRAGTYNILYKGNNGYFDSTVMHIQLKNGDEIKLDPVTLRR